MNRLPDIVGVGSVDGDQLMLPDSFGIGEIMELQADDASRLEIPKDTYVWKFGGRDAQTRMPMEFHILIDELFARTIVVEVAAFMIAKERGHR